nr:retrovirus-related Pol polyprotein from transposon TNT 1-94 [Tanacetum cinerariifolium]
MKMEQYLTHTDYALWEVILNGDSVVQMTKDEADEHLARFHVIKDVKTLWAAIKTRFCGNAESKKMQKNVLKQQFEIFSASNSEGIDKGTPQLDKEDLEQIDQDDLEEMDLKWQVAMLSMRVKRFYKKTERKLEFNGKEPVGFDKNKVESFNCHRRGHFVKDYRSAKNSENMSRDARMHDTEEEIMEEATDFALMALTSNPSSSSSSNSEETDSDDDNVFRPEPIPAKIDFVKADESIKHVKPVVSVKHGPPQQALKNKGIVDSGALVTKTHNKTHYELLNGRSPRLDFMRPFGCPVTILNTLDPLEKFEGKTDEGFLVGYSVTSKAFRVFNTKTKKVEENLHVRLMSQEKEASDAANALRKEFEQGCMDQRGVTQAGSTNSFNTVSNPVNAASTLGTFSVGGPSSPHPDAFIPANTLLHVDQDDSQIPDLKKIVELQSTGVTPLFVKKTLCHNLGVISKHS